MRPGGRLCTVPNGALLPADEELPAPLAEQTALAAPGHATSSARNQAGHTHGPVSEPKTVSVSVLCHRSVCLQHHLLEATLVAYGGRGSMGRRQKRRDQTHAMSQVRRDFSAGTMTHDGTAPHTVRSPGLTCSPLPRGPRHQQASSCPVSPTHG